MYQREKKITERFCVLTRVLVYASNNLQQMIVVRATFAKLLTGIFFDQCTTNWY